MNVKITRSVALSFIALVSITFQFLVWASFVWVSFSLVISGIKLAAGDCGKHYPVEVVASGDWLCSND